MKETVDYYTRSLDCVHCGLCLEACPTYGVLGLETDSPRGRIYLMRALAEDRIDDVASIRPHLDQCLDCRACETACPSGVRYGQIIETVRSDLERRIPRKGLGARLRRFLLRQIVARQGRLRVAFRLAALAERIGLRRAAVALGLLPKTMDDLVPHVPRASERRPIVGRFLPDGEPRGKVWLFTGCVMEQVFGRINQATLRLLLANGFEVEVPAAQGCCGALLLHDGQADDARALARENLTAFGDGDEPIVNNSAGCGAAMREYGELLGTDAAAAFAERCVDVSALLARHGLTATPAALPRRVAYDAPCHLCHGQGVHDAPRELLEHVPGIELVSNPGAEDCCGSAGIYNLLQPELAGAIGERKARELRDSGAEIVATGNPGCMMQIGAHLRRLGSDIRVAHPVELLLPEHDQARDAR